MSNYRLKQQENRASVEYKEPYEFRLMIGNAIICQRYFKINDFNPISLSSIELANTVRACAQMIDDDLKSKSRIYTWHMAPLVFKNEDEMRRWFANPDNVKGVRLNELITFRDEKLPDYRWNGEKLVLNDKVNDDKTFNGDLSERDFITYEFGFFVNDRKVISTTFEGVYPYFIRRNIDLSNTRGKFEGDDLSRLSFDSYLLNCLVVERPNLIKKIVEELAYVCSVPENDYYTTSDTYVGKKGMKKKYNFNIKQIFEGRYGKEMADYKKYLVECELIPATPSPKPRWKGKPTPNEGR